jgi:hypothetical protein
VKVVTVLIVRALRGPTGRDGRFLQRCQNLKAVSVSR